MMLDVILNKALNLVLNVTLNVVLNVTLNEPKTIWNAQLLKHFKDNFT